MWSRIFFSLLTSSILCILRVNSYQNCYHKEFVQNTAEDNLLFETGLLLEVNVSHRAECVSLSHLHGGCNLILYNPSTALCRLHHYEHASQTGTGVTETGWTNYARQCTGQTTVPDCNITDTSLLESCQSCFYDNAWGEGDMCIKFTAYFTNTGGDSVNLDMNFDLEAGMDILVKGTVYNTETWVGVCLEDTDDDDSHLGINLKLGGDLCYAYSESNDDTCDDVMPQVDLSMLTFTFRLSNNIKISVDGTLITQYENLIRRNRVELHGFGAVQYVHIIRTPDSCN